MRFRRIGRTYQLAIEQPDDLEDVLELDEALWMATSAPVSVFRCDPQFLSFVDEDGNGRINTEEVKSAIWWTLERLADRSLLPEGEDFVPLSAIPADSPEGQALIQSGRYVLENTGAAGDGSISLDQVRAFTAGVAGRPINGSGILVPEAADDEQLAGFIMDAVNCMGGVQDAAGRTGITQDRLEAFMAAVGGYLEWHRGLEIPEDSTATDTMPLGPRTPEAYEAYRACAEPIGTFFALCRAARFDPDVVQTGLSDPTEHEGETSVTGAARIQSLLRQAPPARPGPDATLPLREEELNPAHADFIARLRDEVLGPVLGDVPDDLTEEQWNRVRSALAPYESHLEQKAGAEVEGLGLEKLRDYAQGEPAEQARELFREHDEVARLLEGVRDVEKLLLYHQNLMRLTNNFVSFVELYDIKARALFEMGSVVMDGRWFNFAVKVADPAVHAAAAQASQVFITYLEATGTAADDKFHLAVPVTSGTRGNLSVGKRGVFFDIDGREWDVRIVQIIERPVSLREFLGMPFQRLWGLIVGKIEAWSATAESGLEKGAQQGLASAEASSETPPQPRPQPPVPAAPLGGPAAVVLAVSVGIAALGSAYAFIVKTLAGLALHQILLGVGVAVLAVMLPVSIVAVLKLRRQDLSTLLEACGWAVNGRMRLNRRLRRTFTMSARYPWSARGTPRRRRLRILLVLLAVLIAAAAGVYLAVTYLAG